MEYNEETYGLKHDELFINEITDILNDNIRLLSKNISLIQKYKQKVNSGEELSTEDREILEELNRYFLKVYSDVGGIIPKLYQIANKELF